jgi:hypothetical protein
MCTAIVIQRRTEVKHFLVRIPAYSRCRLIEEGAIPPALGIVTLPSPR